MTSKIGLPEESKGSDADNPGLFEEWENPTVLAASEWPYIVLCEDLDSGSFTWHMLCNEQNIPRAFQIGFKSMVDAHISGERKRNLTSKELVCRRDGKHIFITENSK